MAAFNPKVAGSSPARPTPEFFLLNADFRSASLRARWVTGGSQNWIGGTRPGNAHYVPPPADEVPPAMGALEKFLHNDPVKTPILVKAAPAHAQLESIHPILDGNGRVGRLAITLLLYADDPVLSRPLLYLSLYLKRNRDSYYAHLQRVRTHGEWEQWLRFFLEGSNEVAHHRDDCRPSRTPGDRPRGHPACTPEALRLQQVSRRPRRGHRGRRLSSPPMARAPHSPATTSAIVRRSRCSS